MKVNEVNKKKFISHYGTFHYEVFKHFKGHSGKKNVKRQSSLSEWQLLFHEYLSTQRKKLQNVIKNK